MNVYDQKRTLARPCYVLALSLLLPVVSAFADGTNALAAETPIIPMASYVEVSTTNDVVTISNVVAVTTNDVVTASNVLASASDVLVTTTNSFSPPLHVAGTGTNFPGMVGSVVRMMAGLAFVIALFFGGIWLLKKWQRVSRVRNKSKLNILESRSLGARQAVYVVGYNEQRFLVAASQTGISLLSTLPTAEIEEVTAPVTTIGVSSFAQVLQNALGRK